MQKKNADITNYEIEKSSIDMGVLQKLIKPSAVMFDPLQKSMLIGFFTNRDIFLNKLIPILIVYLDQTKSSLTMLKDFQNKKAEDRKESQVKAIHKQFEGTFEMAKNIIKELYRIHQTNQINSSPLSPSSVESPNSARGSGSAAKGGNSSEEPNSAGSGRKSAL